MSVWFVQKSRLCKFNKSYTYFQVEINKDVIVINKDNIEKMNARLNAVEHKLGIQVETRSSVNGYYIREENSLTVDLTSDRLLPAVPSPDYNTVVPPRAALSRPTPPVYPE